jgi:hypothetical protein
MALRKDKISQTIIDDISEFLILEFLEYYPFNSYQFLLESLSELKIRTTNFSYSFNMLNKNEVFDGLDIENTLWIATIRQRLLIKLNQLKIKRNDFDEIFLTIDSVSYSREKSIVCKVLFKDSSNISYKGKPIKKTIKNSKYKMINFTWLSKMRRFLYS